MVETGKGAFRFMEERLLGRLAQIIFVVGPEGSGKSTQTRKLEEFLGIPRIYTGDKLRAIKDSDDKSPLANRIRKMFEDKKYLDPVDALTIHRKNFSEEGLHNGFIVDGSPRTFDEASGIPDILPLCGFELGRTNITIVQLECPIPVSIQRLKDRRDREGVKRMDDTMEGIAIRLSNYYRDIDSITQFARDNWNLVEIDAGRGEDEVFEEIKQRVVAEKMVIEGRYKIIN